MSKIHVLIVEDDFLLRSGMELVIQAEEDMYVGGTAENGVEALERIRRSRPDVVLMDLQMPVMDGISLRKEIRKFDNDLPILILTTFNEEEYIFQGLSCGANGYLLKGIEFRKLVQTIRDAMNKQYVLPAEVAAKVARYAVNNTGYVRERGLLRYFAQNDQFTAKEQQIILLLINRYSNKEIADKLFFSEGTIKNNLTVIYGKLGVTSWQEAISHLEKLADDYS